MHVETPSSPAGSVIRRVLGRIAIEETSIFIGRYIQDTCIEEKKGRRAWPQSEQELSNNQHDRSCDQVENKNEKTKNQYPTPARSCQTSEHQRALIIS